ncbi:hypothetical protein PEP31012_03564 [Pandoraea eparura]|uniref:Uncharacterized protein n=1 Tax=Pandoraea eparura TaxID=2508291 RepID=A0A5E4WZ97_9BURK|nr:hypothetical protein [Pandoraea eparura]VVE28915.1 hypothetical protein PEP31012_03564 [Pandoraea eparura]
MERTKREMDLMSQVADLRQKLRRAEIALADERVRACGVKVGDIVTHKGEPYRVCSVKPMGFAVWVKGNPRKKNGEFGNSVRALYGDWMLLLAASQAANKGGEA